jgi:hypothetical protein
MNKLLKNEQMFAKLNDGLAKSYSKLSPANYPADFALQLYCECANKACREKMAVAFKEYKEYKTPLTFLVKPEHTFLEFEEKLEEREGYWVIRKKPDKLKKPFEV